MNKRLLNRDAIYRNQVEQLLRELEHLDTPVLNMAAIDGGWSAIQIMHHLMLSEELALKYVRKKLSFNPELKKAGFDAYWRDRVLWLYLNLPFKFRAPEAVNEEKLPGFATLAETRDRWLAIRLEWADFLKQLPNDVSDKAVYRHPIAGRLSWSGTLKFFQYHFNRHRKQINRTLGK